MGGEKEVDEVLHPYVLSSLVNEVTLQATKRELKTQTPPPTFSYKMSPVCKICQFICGTNCLSNQPVSDLSQGLLYITLNPFPTLLV